MRLPILRRVAACLGVLLLAQGADAAEDAPLDSTLRLEARAAVHVLRHEPLGVPTLQQATGRASSSLLQGLRLWAEGAGYAVGRRPAGFRLGAGASLPLAEALALTAGYRLTGFSGGSALDGGSFAVDERVGGAYFGFDLEF